MARPIVLSNGELHVGLNKYGLVHDFYYPYVGHENHAAGQDLRSRIGIWVDGQLSWLDDGDWSFKFRYPHHALIGHVVARNDSLGIIIESDDFVDASLNAFIRNIHIVNMRYAAREVRLFMHQAFNIGDSASHTDTAQYLPDSNAVLHYRGRRNFLVTGLHNDQPFDQHSIGLFGIEGREGTWRDAEDGELANGMVEHGRVDSTLRFVVNLEAHSSERVQYWISAGKTAREALMIDKRIRDDGVSKRLERAATAWHTWLEPAIKVSKHLDKKYRQNFLNSLLIIKSQIDKRGAVIASSDTTMLNYSRDAYGYCWPRDGAFVLWPLLRMGYTDEAIAFFDFCKDVLNPSTGYLMHKYRADGALGSSWHPYVHDGIQAPPIQEDETALVLFLLGQYHNMNPGSEFIESYYQDMVVPMANFLADYIDEVTGLPKPSYDLWEENFLTTTYTTAVVYGALGAASELAEAAGDSDACVKWRSCADDIQRAAHKHLFNRQRQAFYKGVIIRDGHLQYDETIDMSAIFGCFMFGLFKIDSFELSSSVSVAEQVFSLDFDNLNGFPRYENDSYHRTDDSSIGNPWFITTLWAAQYYLETDQAQKATAIMDWVNSKAMKTGVLSEQIDPHDQSFLSVAPLTWTHAEFVATLLDSINKERDEA